jgi:hypothetical protein
LTAHDSAKSVFYYTGPPQEVMGRLVTPCPRCQSTNAVSFQHLRGIGSEAQLWGLEQIVRQRPRSAFEVKGQDVKPTS